MDTFYETLEMKYPAFVKEANLFREELVRQLNSLIYNEGVTLAVPIESRVKEWPSVSNKIQASHNDIQDISELQQKISDLVGIRIILLFLRDVQRIHELLAKTFEILEKEDTLDRLSEREFGYQSIHFLIKTPGNWRSIPTLSGFDGFVAEIQLRTLTQHNWAAASHVLQYKKENQIESNIRRTIHRVAALLEIVDLEFERVLVERDDYRRKLESEISEGILNVDTLEIALDDTIGTDRKEASEDYSGLFTELKLMGIDTKKKLSDLIYKTQDEILSNESLELKRITEDPVLKEYYNLLSPGNKFEDHFFSQVGFVRNSLARQFKIQYFEARNKLYPDEFPKPPGLGVFRSIQEDKE